MTNAELAANLQPSQGKEYADILARLLEEYTAKLRSNVEKLERMQLRFQLVCTIAVMGFLLFTANVIFMLATKYKIHGPLNDATFLANLVGGVVGLMVGGSFVAFCYNYIVKRRMQMSDIKSNMEQVAKLIRYSSQIQEVGVTGFATRLELDFKTTDAEETLELAQGAVKPSPQSLSRVRMTALKNHLGPEAELVWEDPLGKTGTK